MRLRGGNSGEEVLDAQDRVGKGFVDEGTVGEEGKLAVRVRLAEAQEVLRLRIAEVEPIAGFRRPAVCALQAMGGGSSRCTSSEGILQL